MQGKIVAATGATSGIGEKAVEALARQGARIVFIARDRARADATLARLDAAAPGLGHKAHLADLSLMREAKAVGAEIAAAEPRIDVLINNAGAIFSDRRVTAEGLERTFALNHMSYFIVTAELLGSLKEAPQGRVVSTASHAHRGARLDFDDLQGARGYSGWGAYQRSKLANILFTRELARASGGERGDRQLPASRIRRLAFRRRGGRLDGARVLAAQALRHVAGTRRRHDRLSRQFPGCRRGERRLFRQAQDRRLFRRRARQRRRSPALGDQRDPDGVCLMAAAQCDMSTGKTGWRNRSRLTLPNRLSKTREWPKAPGDEEIGGLGVEACEQRLDRRDVSGVRPIGNLRRHAVAQKMLDQALLRRSRRSASVREKTNIVTLSARLSIGKASCTARRASRSPFQAMTMFLPQEPPDQSVGIISTGAPACLTISSGSAGWISLRTSGEGEGAMTRSAGIDEVRWQTLATGSGDMKFPGHALGLQSRVEAVLDADRRLAPVAEKRIVGGGVDPGEKGALVPGDAQGDVETRRSRPKSDRDRREYPYSS